MHLVYLGAMRQLIRHWVGDKGRHNKNYKLSVVQINTISERLVNLSYVLPSDFNRCCRFLELKNMESNSFDIFSYILEQQF